MLDLKIWIAIGGAAGLLLAGCGEETAGKLPVSGTITIKGAPVDAGTINFFSQPPTPDCFTGALITDGKYSVPAVQGLLPGTYRVQISAPVQGPPSTDPVPGEAGPLAEDRIPVEYNANSKLTFEAKSGAANKFDFDVP